MSDLDIAIVGMSGAFPGAADVEQFWKNLAAGRCSLERFTEQDLEQAGISPSDFRREDYVRVGGRVGDVDLFDNDFFGISNRDAELMDPQHRRFFQYAWKAFEHAGYDVSRFKGRIGVYAGISLNTYLTTVLLRSSAVNLERDGQSIIFGNLSDYVTTRLSYLLDLKGPSINVQTACSTSLVAIHEACQGLLSYQSDMALAGGCSLTLPDARGYIYRKDGFFSPDGAVRAFDEKAAGTVFSNGIGLVVLKRRADAERDGDHIYAILKGVAINNDGADKVGYTAPSISGQARAIRDALELSDVHPEDIEYIETHGTGTELGDPVEVAALTDAFRTGSDKKQFCALGSVKTNIGHTDVAAGAAGIIKAALSLHHKVLPASLNYEQPNPRLELATSPFYVNARTRSWETKKARRHAGVSSFGIGGTNAHAILEEAPAYEARPGTRPAYCLTLSARTPESLRALVERYRAFLAEGPRFSWADICFTSNLGRKAFAHRQVVVAPDVAGALAQLEAATLAPSEARHRKLVVRAEGGAEALAAWLREAAPGAHQALAGTGSELGEVTVAYVVQRLRAYGIDARPARAARLSSAALEKLRALPGLEAGEAAAAEPSAEDCVLVLGREPLFQCQAVEVRPSQLAAKEGLFTALLGLAWKYGASVDWSKSYGDERRTRVPLPTYEFARKRHWVATGPAASSEEAANTKITDINKWFYKPVWRESATPVRTGHGLEGSIVLVLGPDRESFRTSSLLKGARVIHVMPGAELRALGGDVYTLNPSDENGYRLLLEELQRQNALPRYVLHAWLVDRKAWPQDASDFQDYQERGLYSLLFLVRQFGRLGLGEQKLSVITAVSHLVNVSGSEEINPNKSPVLGATRTIPKEFSNIECRVVDVSAQDLLESPRSFLRVVDEFHAPLKPENEVVAIRAGHRWRPFFERVEVPQEQCPNPVLTTGAYVIFGGLGEFGLNLAAYLVDRARCTLVLAGSSKFVERSEWDSWVAQHGPSHSYSKKIALLKELEARGARVEVVQCDLTDEALVHRTLDRIREQYGTLNGIVHAAGIVENGMIDRKDVRQIDGVFKAKVHGTYSLLNYVKQGRGPKLILASSMNSIIGGLGQIDNTATNAFIDTLATTPLVQALGDITAINWGAVDAERVARANVLPQFADLSREHKKNYMTDKEIHDVYDRVLAWPFGPRLVVSTIDFAMVLERWGEVSRVTELSRLRQVASSVAASASEKKAPVTYRSKVHQFVAESWSGILGVPEIGWESNLFDLGAHSLGSVQFVSMLKDSLGVSLHAMNVYEFQKLGVLVEYVEKLVQEKEARALINRSGR